MFARAGLAFVALPGVVAFAVPGIWLLASSHTARSATGSGVDTRRLGWSALVRTRLLRFGQGHARSLGSAGPTRRRWPVSLYAQSHVHLAHAHTSGLGDVIRLAGLVHLRHHRGRRFPLARGLWGGALACTHAWC